MSGLRRHTLRRPPGLLECDRVLDIGAGIRPMRWFEPCEHVCVEPYGPYADMLRAHGYEVVHATALEALAALADASFDAVHLLDVVEHMVRAEGLQTLQGACRVAARQVVVFTPDGYRPQDFDAWGMGGGRWQTHRSGWTAADFASSDGWVVHTVRDEDGADSLFAVWNRP